MLAFAVAQTPATASAAPSREDDATDALYGGQTSPGEDTPRKDGPGSTGGPPEGKPEPAPSEPKPASTSPAGSEPPEDPGPTSSRAPGSDSAVAHRADDEPVPTDDVSTGNDVDAAAAGGAEEPRRDEAPSRRGMSHYRQGSLTVMPGWGFSAIVPYEKRIFCGEFSDDPGSSTKRKSFCTMGSPWFIEFTGGYGVHPRIDLMLGVRVHVQKRDYRCRKDDELDSCKGMFNDSLAVGLAPGIRAWISDPERIFKVGGAIDFIWMHESFGGYRRRGRCEGRDDSVNGPCPVEEPLEGYESSRADEARVKDDDIGFRIGPVFQIDPHPNVGIVVLPAARMGLLRWFEFSFDIALGVQARFP